MIFLIKVLHRLRKLNSGTAQPLAGHIYIDGRMTISINLSPLKHFWFCLLFLLYHLS